jgi:DNA polymerase-3 subunit epsilon
MPRGPRRAGRRRPWPEGSYVALDFETTGLDHRRDAIVSYGVVPVEGGRALLEGSVHQLVRPTVPPSPRSQTIHLLRPLDLEGAPTIEQAAEDLRARLAGRFLLTWFAEVEVGFLATALGGTRRAWRRRTIDVRNLAIAVDEAPASARTDPGYPLSATARRYGVPVAAPHEAFDDALVTAQLFLVLAEKLATGPRPSIGDLVRVAGA